MDKTCKSSGDQRVAISAGSSGARVSNTWVICPEDRYNPAKAGLIPDVIVGGHPPAIKSWGSGQKPDLALQDEPAAYQLVGEVTAHQGSDG